VLKKLFAPGLEQVLAFRDERLLRATSNAVERGNRRYRKMQKTVDWGWTRRTIEGRPALDLLRERQARGQAETTRSLHKTRAAGGNDPISLLQSPLLAGSSDLLCQVPDVLALEVFTDPPDHLRRQLPIGLEDRPRAGDPARLDRLEPRALERQTTSHDPHTPSRLTRRWCAWIQARTR
jgi:hypothetical protein